MTTVELYRVIEQQVQSLTKHQRRWVDDKWQSITENWANELKELAIEAVGDEDEDEQRGTCEDCPAKLSGDDKGDRCQDCQEQYDLLICGCCDERVENSGFGSSVNQGCCSDGACGHEPKIEVLCGDCGTWDEEDEVWRCPDCQEEHEEHLRIHRILIRGDPLPCETCKKPVWSNNDVYQKIHDCIVCQDCFDENEKAHEPPEPDGDGSGDE